MTSGARMFFLPHRSRIWNANFLQVFLSVNSLARHAIIRCFHTSKFAACFICVACMMIPPPVLLTTVPRFPGNFRECLGHLSMFPGHYLISQQLLEGTDYLPFTVAFGSCLRDCCSICVNHRALVNLVANQKPVITSC